MSKQPELTEADRKIISESWRQYWNNNDLNSQNMRSYKDGFEAGILHAREEGDRLLNEQGRIMQQRIKELEAEVARLKEEIALFFRTNVQAPRTAFERLAKAASKPYNSPTVVQSSVQSPKATPRCFKCGSFDLVPSSTGGTACWKCHAEQPPSVQSPEAKSYNFPPLTKDQQYWFDLWGKGSKDIPTSWEQRPPIESPSLVNDQLLEACKSALWSGAIRFANNALDRSIKEKLEAAIAKASKEEL
jgi:hypothetical protein